LSDQRGQEEYRGVLRIERGSFRGKKHGVSRALRTQGCGKKKPCAARVEVREKKSKENQGEKWNKLKQKSKGVTKVMSWKP